VRVPKALIPWRVCDFLLRPPVTGMGLDRQVNSASE
jgi:hypothetical protein